MTWKSGTQPVAAGVTTALVGFASSFAVILKGLTAVGASDAETATGLMALSIAMGVAGIGLSLAWRMPISLAWSTNGAALLAAAGVASGGFPEAVGAFLVVGALIVAAGLVRPFGQLVAAIPGPVANAMLAGVLFGLCLAPIRALINAPGGASLIVASWLIVSRWKRVYATPIAAVIAGGDRVQQAGTAFDWALMTPRPIFVAPTMRSRRSRAMASQNIPGPAVLRAYGYRPSPGPLVAITGLFTLAAAPFGGHAVNLSAITAALCASPDTSPDPGKRWLAAATAGRSMSSSAFSRAESADLSLARRFLSKPSRDSLCSTRSERRCITRRPTRRSGRRR